MGSRFAAAVNGPAIPFAAVVLMGIRFLAPSVAAAMAVQGMDTSAVGVVFPVVDALAVVLGVSFLVLLLSTWPGALDRDGWILLSVLCTGGSVLAWAGTVDSAYRVVSGPWATLPLSAAVTASILVFGVALDARLERAAIGRTTRLGFRALCGGFGTAYLLGALRFIDYRVALGMALPGGVLWLLDYGPTFLPCFIALYFWLDWAGRRPSKTSGALAAVGPPVLGAAAGVAISQGLGGFILSNVLAWGGAYEVFAPTAVSLAIVGFAVGAFLATAWALRGRMAGPSWRLVVGGVAVTALAGVQFFEGALASLVGILLGLTLAACGVRSLADSMAAQSPRDPRAI